MYSIYYQDSLLTKGEKLALWASIKITLYLFQVTQQLLIETCTGTDLFPRFLPVFVPTELN